LGSWLRSSHLIMSGEELTFLNRLYRIWVLEMDVYPAAGKCKIEANSAE
jgi:hypothetical protein